jgi:hypothetical protein
MKYITIPISSTKKHVSINAEIMCNLMTIVNTMNIYKDNDFKTSINKIRVIINNNVKNTTDKKNIHNFIKKSIELMNERKLFLFYGKTGKKIVWILMCKN